MRQSLLAAAQKYILHHRLHLSKPEELSISATTIRASPSPASEDAQIWERRMNTVAHLFDQFSTTSVRRDDETPVIQAFGTVARHLRGPLASLLVFMEVADLYRRSKASANPELRHVLFGMLRRAKATGDPLGYRAG